MQITYQHGVFENHIFMVYNLGVELQVFCDVLKIRVSQFDCARSGAVITMIEAVIMIAVLELNVKSSHILYIYIYTVYSIYTVYIYIYITSRLVHRI